MASTVSILAVKKDGQHFVADVWGADGKCLTDKAYWDLRKKLDKLPPDLRRQYSDFARAYVTFRDNSIRKTEKAPDEIPGWPAKRKEELSSSLAKYQVSMNPVSARVLQDIEREVEPNVLVLVNGRSMNSGVVATALRDVGVNAGEPPRSKGPGTLSSESMHIDRAGYERLALLVGEEAKSYFGRIPPHSDIARIPAQVSAHVEKRAPRDWTNERARRTDQGMER